MIRNRQLTELRRDVPLDRGPADLELGQWDRETLNTLFDTLQFRVLRERLYATFSVAEPETAEQGFDDGRRGARPGRRHASGSTSTPAAAERHGISIAGTWGRGTGVVTGLAIAAPDGAAAYLDPEQLTADDEQALAGLAGRPGGAEGGPRRQGPDARR